MSQQSKTTLQSAINTQIADNTSGDISAADIRNNLINITDSLLFNTGSQAITGSLTVTEGATLISASTSQTINQGAINLQSTSSTIIPSIILASSNGTKYIKIGHSGGYNSISSAGDTWIYGSTSLNLESNNDVNIWSRLNATQGVIVTGSLTTTGGITGSLLGTASFATTASHALNAGGGSAFPYTGSAVISGSLTITGSINSTGSVALGVPNMFGNRNLDISFNNQNESATLAAGVNSSKTNAIELIGQTGTTTVRAENIFYLFSPIANIVASTTNITGSLRVTGSLGITGSVGVQNGDITVTPSSTNTKIAITDGFMKNEMKKTSTVIANQASPNNFSIGTYIYDPTNSPFFPLSNAIYSGGTTDLLISSQQKLNIEATSTEITGSLKITGSTSLNGLMTLQPANPLPSVVNGSIVYSSSGDFYFGSGSAWRKLTL